MAKQVRIDSLVRDFTLYPRTEVRDYHVTELARAMEAGTQLPALIADRVSRRIVDGFHRSLAAQRLWGSDAEYLVEFRSFADEKEMLRFAIQTASSHGLRLDRQEQIRCIHRAQEIGVTLDEVAADLSVTMERVNELVVRIAQSPEGKKVALKHPVAHLQGQKLTSRQLEGIERAGGNPQIFYFNQAISLIEHDLLDRSNARLIERVLHLRDLLAKEFGDQG